jgi:hypothetical protein
VQATAIPAAAPVLNPLLFSVPVSVEGEEAGVLLPVLAPVALCLLAEIALLEVEDDVGADELVVGELVVTASGDIDIVSRYILIIFIAIARVHTKVEYG